MTLKEVCDWLGHSLVLVTERVYAFPGEDALQKALDRAVPNQGQDNVVAIEHASKEQADSSMSETACKAMYPGSSPFVCFLMSRDVELAFGCSVRR